MQPPTSCGRLKHVSAVQVLLVSQGLRSKGGGACSKWAPTELHLFSVTQLQALAGRNVAVVQERRVYPGCKTASRGGALDCAQAQEGSIMCFSPIVQC